MNKEKRKESPLYEYARFSIAGILNTASDFIVLNILLSIFGATTGPLYTLSKIVSFTVAVIQSYFLNKNWVFRASSNGKSVYESGKFFVISAAGLLINAATSTIFYTVFTRTGIDPLVAANAGAILGTILVMLWNYTGYKFFVFAPTKNP